MKTFPTLAALKAAVGQDLGATGYVTVTQEMVNQFADATGDHQWIHVDVEKARQFSPFGGPIAHGFLTLSLAPQIDGQPVPGRVGQNGRQLRHQQGCVSPTPYRLGQKSGCGPRWSASEDFPNNGVRLMLNATFEREGSDKPVCVAELVSLLFE